MIDSKYVRNLIYLNGKSITSIALEAGVDPTNLSRFLKGHSTVSDEKMKKVLEHLGVDSVTGTLKPIVHHWRARFNLATFNLIDLDKLISDLVPGKGKIINLVLKDDARWTAIVGNDGPRIIMDNYDVVLEEFLPEWENLYRRITPTALKRLIEDEALTPSEFDKILGLNYETPLLDGDSLVAEDQMETEYDRGWTWEAVVRRAKESGLKPEEVAKRLGIEGHHE